MTAIGDSVGHYRLTGLIGRGAMATVFRAHDERLNRDVALKLLDPGYSLDFIFRARFEREFRVTSQLNNDHIVPVYDAGAWDDQLYIAMALIDGPNLAEVMRDEGPLQVSRVVSIVSQVADALDEAHRHRVIHRDVKPANVLLVHHGQSETEHAYLADFGLTLGMEGTHLTRTGGFMGTLAYSAPEQLNSAPIDGRADEYGLAATTYQMLTGELPFKRDNEMALINAHLFDPVPKATDLRPDLPPRVDAVIARGMAKRPEDRYATAGEFAKALAQATAGTATAGTAAAGPARALATRTSRANLPIGSRIGLIAAASLGAVITFAFLSNYGARSNASPTVPASNLVAVASASAPPASAQPSASASATLPTQTPLLSPTPTRNPHATATPKGPPPTPPVTPSPTPTFTPPADLPLVAAGNWMVQNSPSGVSGDPYVVVGAHSRRYVINPNCTVATDCRLGVVSFDSATGKRLGTIAFKWNGSAYTYRGRPDWYARAGGSSCQASTGDVIADAYATHEEVSVSPSQTQNGVATAMTGTKTISGTPTAAGTAAGCAPFAMTYTVTMSAQ